MTMKADDPRAGSEPAPVSRTTSLARVWRGLLVFYALALALNGVALHGNNEKLPYGPVRSFWVAVSAPVGHACSALKLDALRSWVAGTVGSAVNP